MKTKNVLIWISFILPLPLFLFVDFLSPFYGWRWFIAVLIFSLYTFYVFFTFPEHTSLPKLPYSDHHPSIDDLHFTDDFKSRDLDALRRAYEYKASRSDIKEISRYVSKIIEPAAVYFHKKETIAEYFRAGSIPEFSCLFFLVPTAIIVRNTFFPALHRFWGVVLAIAILLLLGFLLIFLAIRAASLDPGWWLNSKVAPQRVVCEFEDHLTKKTADDLHELFHFANILDDVYETLVFRYLLHKALISLSIPLMIVLGIVCFA